MLRELKPVIWITIFNVLIVFSYTTTQAATDCHGQQILTAGSCVGDDVDTEEAKLHRLVNEYRAQHGLPAIPLSPSLNLVANRHVLDLVDNISSYSRSGLNWPHGWSDCAYDANNRETLSCMWNAPQRLKTAYTGYGYENLCGGPEYPDYVMTANYALECWQESSAHNAVILNQGESWQDRPWNALGVGIYKGYAVLWFGEEKDLAGTGDTTTPPVIDANVFTPFTGKTWTFSSERSYEEIAFDPALNEENGYLFGVDTKGQLWLLGYNTEKSYYVLLTLKESSIQTDSFVYFLNCSSSQCDNVSGNYLIVYDDGGTSETTDGPYSATGQQKQGNTPLPDDNPYPTLGDKFNGGISVNGGGYVQRVEQNLSDPVDVTGTITIDPVHVGNTVNIFVYAKATLPTMEAYFMLGENFEILAWDLNPNNLVAFQRNVSLLPVQAVAMYNGKFIYPGTLEIFFGYQLADGTLVSNSTPITVTINETANNSSTVYHLTRVEGDRGGDGSIEWFQNFTSDANGKLIQTELYNNQGELLYTGQFAYDNEGHLIEEEWDTSRGKGIVTYTYDAYGELTEKRSIDYSNGSSSEFVSTSKNSYDANGSLIKREFDDGASFNYTYDANRRLVKEEYNGNYTGSYYYTYDENGKLIKVDNSYETGSYLYFYDLNGQLLQEGRDQNGDGLIDVDGTYKIYTYDANGRITKVEGNEYRNSSNTYLYDTNGNIAQETDEIGNVTRYTWQQGLGYSMFHLTDPCLLVSRRNSPEEQLFDSVFTNSQ
ncbi:MAG: hypothetical protein BWK79_16305 [Beggiatoa sp. IS2]|nr:MAG: hypothetical protein BWK79_16305 [Beggiatoa sp. IS2]